jgi:hypothetical protein
VGEKAQATNIIEKRVIVAYMGQGLEKEKTLDQQKYILI